MIPQTSKAIIKTTITWWQKQDLKGGIDDGFHEVSNCKKFPGVI